MKGRNIRSFFIVIRFNPNISPLTPQSPKLTPIRIQSVAIFTRNATLCKLFTPLRTLSLPRSKPMFYLEPPYSLPRSKPTLYFEVNQIVTFQAKSPK